MIIKQLVYCLKCLVNCRALCVHYFHLCVLWCACVVNGRSCCIIVRACLVIARALCLHYFALCVLCCALTAVVGLFVICGLLGSLGIESRCNGNIFMVVCSQKFGKFI